MSKETIEQMWEKFAEHQPEADRLGYGAAWQRMCDERTEEAVDAAWWAAWVARGAARAARWAAEAASWAAASWAAADAADAERWAERAIECINQAEENK